MEKSHKNDKYVPATGQFILLAIARWITPMHQPPMLPERSCSRSLICVTAAPRGSVAAQAPYWHTGAGCLLQGLRWLNGQDSAEAKRGTVKVKRAHSEKSRQTEEMKISSCNLKTFYFSHQDVLIQKPKLFDTSFSLIHFLEVPI